MVRSSELTSSLPLDEDAAAARVTTLDAGMGAEQDDTMDQTQPEAVALQVPN